MPNERRRNQETGASPVSLCGLSTSAQRSTLAESAAHCAQLVVRPRVSHDSRRYTRRTNEVACLQPFPHRPAHELSQYPARSPETSWAGWPPRHFDMFELGMIPFLLHMAPPRHLQGNM